MAVANGELVEIFKASMDKREYRRIILKNSLEVLLISDPDTDKHGGSINAFTSSEQTNYYFDVNTDCFEEALDRFAQFFIKPLMSADATTREIKAVDSESEELIVRCLENEPASETFEHRGSSIP